MTNKELLYVEDALEHEQFLKCCATQNIQKFSDTTLSNYMQDLVKEHTSLYNKFLNLL